MKQFLLGFGAALLAMLASAAFVASASASFGLHNFDVTFKNADGSPATQAGSHPFEFTTSFEINTKPDAKLGVLPDEEFKDLFIKQIPGLVGNPTATPRCTNLDFVTPIPGERASSCADSTAIGTALVRAEKPNAVFAAAVYNLVPPPGVAAKIGFVVFNVPVTVEAGVNPEPPYNITAVLSNAPQVTPVYSSIVTLWGNPADPRHDPYRGRCVGGSAPYPQVPSVGTCPTDAPEKPFLTLPRACNGPLTTTWEADSWQNPGGWVGGLVQTHDTAAPPQPLGMTDCAKLGFSPTVEAKPTTSSAESSTGLDFDLSMHDEGIISATGIATQSDIRKAVTTLPKGMTVNPSSASGLAVCKEADLKRETFRSAPGAGCPEASKLGTIQVQTPILEDETLSGSLYIAEPYANPFGTLFALYMVIRSEKLGVIVKLPLKVEPDPKTGQLVTTLEDSPQFPVSSFKLHFREGPRSPLVTPPTCGTHTTQVELTPWSGGPPITTTSSFDVTSGVNAGPCPSGGVPPFRPDFEAGSVNNQAGAYSPFNMRLTRQDGEQDMTRFSSILPPGVTGKLAGVLKCSDAAIESAKRKTGKEELANPSCPAGSEIGRILAGAGVGGSLTYVPGKIYLGGPFGGDPLSVVVITPAVAGPFDVGTVVTREALTLDPTTAEVQVDGSHSDPIPHILAGVPLKLRDLRVYVNRSNFTLNPTSCEPSAVRATLFGGFLDVFSSADDVPVPLSSRFQAANCASLKFGPKLSLRLKGGTKRGGHPALRAVVDYPRGGGYANIGKAVVTLPHSAFLEQAHIRTVCTRVQYAAKQCPRGSIYGFARATTPLLDEPLEGPVYLRSSSHPLPDLVAALHGVVDIDLVGRIDSVNARIRSTFESVPDAPVSKFVLEMRGGKRGLIVNSRNLCPHKSRAAVRLTGQNGKVLKSHPMVIAANCKKKHKKQSKSKAKRRATAGSKRLGR